MRFLTRTMTMLVVIHLMTGGLAPAQEGKTYTISGSAGMAGVMMEGLPGDPVTDADGKYSVTINHDWKGTVTPMKEGVRFNPRARTYNRASDFVDQDYAPMLVKFTISGSVATEGVIMKGLPGLPITSKDGKYRATVDYGWSGTVTPTKAGYVFEPVSRRYSSVKDSQNNDYWPTKIGPVAMLGRSGSRKALVVPANEIKAEDLAEIIEDMRVMSHILDERFKQTRRIQGMFADFGDFFGRDNRTAEATYLQGYGILFAMEVNFTFSPPTEPAQQEAETATEDADPTWQQARQEVFQPGTPRRSATSESSEEQGRRMVEELKKDLIATLKHAANIRVLQPDEWIILTIIGDSSGYGGFGGDSMGRMGGMMGGMGGMMGGYSGGSSSGGGGSYGGGFGGNMGGMSMGGESMGGMRMGGGMGMGGMGGGGMGGGGMGMMGGGMGGFGGTGASPATVLTIRAKKSDVDAFAKGELEVERFQEKVKTVMY